MGLTKKALIVVRTYPVPARKGVEVSCTAAITDTGEWLRLFPVPYRRLPPHQKFHKYQWIEVNVIRASDPRPESHKIAPDSIKILSEIPTDHEWQLRKNIIFPLRTASLCAMKRRRDDYGSPTLGIFKPIIDELQITPAESSQWSEEQIAILGQGDLFDQEPPSDLEKIPWDFRYKFRCQDEPDCTGHRMICTDWEMMQSWREWRTKYGDDWEQKFRQRYELEMKERYDTHFYVGTLHAYPSKWIVVGLFYPPKSRLALFPDD
jgi:hypothetical protein